MEIIMTKNYVHGSLSDATIMAEKSTSRKRKRTDCWPDSGYFKQDCNKFSLVKANANIPEMTLFYLNNASLYASKNDDTYFYAENYIIAQIIPLANSPTDLSTYELKPDEVKILKTQYNVSTGQFLELIESIGQITVRGDAGEIFFDYGFDEKKGKVVFSTQKAKIPNCFRSGMFSIYKEKLQQGKLSTDFSRVYYYIPPTTDRIEPINQHMGNVHLKPIDVGEGEFGEGFNPLVLDTDTPESKRARESVIKVLKKCLMLVIRL